MKSREILLVVLVVAIALGSGLIGLYLGRSSVQQAAAPSAEQAIELGEPVAAGKVRLFGNAQKTNLAFEIENNRVYQGTVSQGQPVLFFNNTTVFRGANESGEKLFTVKDGAIYEGAQASGAPVWTIDGERVHEGTANGPTVYVIQGDRFFQGATADGSQVVFAANTDLTGSVRFLLPILATQRY
ncbi:MAG: hypothetical protein MAG451_00390 [Anaerolineales bacterium]|nr:hypothetical protein [Anaerolineales bacterium]